MAKKASAKNGAAMRVNRAEVAIEQILKEHNVVITAAKVMVIFRAGDKTTGHDVMSLTTFARLCGLPEGTILIPQVRLEPARTDAPS